MSADVPFVFVFEGDAPVLDRVVVSLMSFTIWRTDVRLYDVTPPPPTARGGVERLGR